MAITNYAELQATIGNWLNRSDLATVIPDFIRLAEAQIARRLRRTTVRGTLAIDAAVTPLPVDCAELRSLRLVSGTPRRDLPFRLGTPEILAEQRAILAPSGRPQCGAVVGRELLVAPAPNGPYVAEVTYFEQLVPLSAANPVNRVLQEAPDLYLYGALKEAEPYLEHDERIPVWTAKFESALTELEIAREREEFNASLQPVRLPRVF